MAIRKQALSRSNASSVAALPVVTIGSPTVLEGDAGASYLVFNVTLSAPSSTPISFGYQTANGTAVAAGD